MATMDLSDLSAAELLTLLLWGEARGEPPMGKLAVAHVVLNRALHPSWWGNSVKSVILKPKQFSCFNPGDPNLPGLERMVTQGYYDPACLVVAQLALAGATVDPTKGATHFCAVGCDPSWADDAEKMEFVVKINRHRFYKERKKGR